ncbi:transporter substrate-binding protein [Planktothrix agardhii]|jgi:PAS domain S-box-containing protein|uniref:transporter substrate-binding protein n=1 Tax=Planktothrix agardhii TaxID=1160 RepID=UPI0028A5B402|nr:transporter substrate-binding protein [Planktothrix agardhii]
MTIAQINDQGGVLGQIIEPVIEDGASDCFTFEQKAQKLIQQDGVTTLFGCWTTASRHAVRPVLEAFNAQLWYPASYEGLENCSQIFYTGFCANQQVELTINWLLRNQKTRCYLLGWDQVFSYTLNKLMKVHLKHYGGEVVGEAYLPSSTMDFEAIITRIRQAQPDIIINTLRGDRNLSFYRQFYESGIKASDLPILATSLSEKESNDNLVQEIVQHQRSENALRMATDQLQTVLEAVPGTVSWIDSDLCYIEVNQRLANMLNLPRERFIGQHIGFLGTSSEFQDFVQDLFDSPEIDAYREVRNQVNGEWRHYLIVAQKYNYNRAAFVVGIDITERKQAEESLRNAKNQLQTVLEAVPGTVSWIDSDLCYIEVNQRLSNMLNLPRERFVGQHIGFLGTSSEFQDFVQDLFNSPEIDAYREVRNQVNGEWRHYLIVAQKYNHNQAAFVVGIDITDRKQAEESLRNAKNQLQTVLEAVPGTVSWINSDLRYIEVNQRLADMFGMPRETFIDQHIGFLGNHSGFTQFIEDLFNSYAIYKKIVTTNSEVLYSPTEELLGKTVFEVFPASHATLFYNQIQEVLNTKQTLNIEYSLVSAEYKPGHPGTNSSPLNPGDEVWFAAMVSPMPDNCVIWVARNTTERRRVLEALQAEREKSERLLLNILPPSIAEQLKQNQHSIAERFEQATIMFADIVDFTGFSARISPSELVNFLNQVFSAFDELAEKHHLEKIKTIGDSYMVAGGLPTPRHDHVEAMAEMALDMQAEIRRFQGQMGQSCNLRIGINTGPVVAGVIGTKKFIYDLWGDAVNIASRMESQGEVGKIQVTATTKNLLNGKYDFEERGLIDVKGRGEMLTYWLTKRRLV